MDQIPSLRIVYVVAIVFFILMDTLTKSRYVVLFGGTVFIVTLYNTHDNTFGDVMASPCSDTPSVANDTHS